MDMVGLSMEILLAVLLVAALIYGVRLEKKLKALRDSQAGFAQAVMALDAAAAKAGAGLEGLKQVADETHDELHDRILKARELKTELERLMARAERLGPALQPAPPAPASGLEGLRALAESVAPHVLPERQPARPAQDRPVKPARSAAHNLDEDLFEGSGDFR